MAKLIDTGDMLPHVMASAQKLVSAIDLRNVRLISFHAARHEEQSGAPAKANIQTTTQFVASKGLFATKFEWEVSLVDENNEQVAEMHATFIVDYSIPKEFEPDEDAANHVAATTGFMAVYPYAREFIQSASARLQLDPLVIGLLRISDMEPRSVTMVSRRDGQSNPATKDAEPLQTGPPL